jgi:hypothetical protein
MCLTKVKIWIKSNNIFTNYNISICSWRDVLDTTLCDKICLWLATGLWFSSGTPVSSTNKAEFHDIAEILLQFYAKYNIPLVSKVKFSILDDTWTDVERSISRLPPVNHLCKVFSENKLNKLILYRTEP